MQPDHGPKPSQILDELLTRREAAALQQEAAHRWALAVCSAIKAGRERARLRTAQLGHERLVHRLDRWHRRPVQAGEGVLVLGVLAAGMNLLDTVELSPPLAGSRLLLATLAANVVWVTMASLAGLAGRARRWAMVAPATGAAGLLALLLAAIHGASSRRGWITAWGQDYRSTVDGILFGLLLLALAAGAAVLIAHIEPATCSVARHRWRRARVRYEAAVESKLADARAASAAMAAWLGLVRSYASEAAGDEEVVEATVALATDLLANGRPGFPPAMHLPARPGQGQTDPSTAAAARAAGPASLAVQPVRKAAATASRSGPR